MKTAAGILFWLVAAIGGLSLTSCTTWKPVVLPSGLHGYTVDCSGTNLSWSHCYQKAGRACPQGYDITRRINTHAGKAVSGDLFGLLGGSVDGRMLLIQCRNDSLRPYGQPAATTGATTYPLGSGP